VRRSHAAVGVHGAVAAVAAVATAVTAASTAAGQTCAKTRAARLALLRGSTRALPGPLARAGMETGDSHLDRGRQVEEGSQVLDPLVGEVVVVVLPAERFTDVLAALERLHHVHDVQVGHVNLAVLLHHRVLLDDADAILEELAVDGDAVLLGHQHCGGAGWD
jgi:hypothetical protein